MPRNVQAHHAAANRRPEGNVDLILEIGTRPRGPSARLVRRARPRRSIRKCRESCRRYRCSSGPGPRCRPGRKNRNRRNRRERLVPHPPRRESRREILRKGPSVPLPLPLFPGSCISFLRRCRINIVGVKPDLVVDFAFLGIAENVVGLRERLELLLRGLVPRVDVGMVFAGQLAERLAGCPPPRRSSSRREFP